MLKCGLYESDITPPLGAAMSGYFHARFNEGAKDPLVASAVCFEGEEGKRVYLFSCDILDFPSDVASKTREALSFALGVPRENILIAATHSHTSISTSDHAEGLSVDDSYFSFLEEALCVAGERAAAALAPVRLSYGSMAEERVGYCRNFVTKDGGIRSFANHTAVAHYANIDHDVTVLRMDAEDGTPLGAIVGYACHPDTLGGNLVSADYPGELRRTLRAVYGERFTPAFFNGFCGNINHVSLEGKRYPDSYRRMGRMLAGDVLRLMEITAPMQSEKVDCRERVLSLPGRRPTEDELAWAKSDAPGALYPHFDPAHRRGILEVEARGEVSYSAPVQVVRVGDAAFYALPGEIFSAFSLRLKAEAPAHLACAFPVNLANGNLNYIPTADLFLDTIYESFLGVSSFLAQDAGDRMVDTLLSLASEV